MALLKDGTRIFGTLYANTEVVIGSMNVASQINASFLQANSANILAQAAFNTANTASANTVYTQGVDNTQNTNITAVNTYATSAYGHANAAFTQANVGATFVNTGGTVSGNVTFTKDVSVTGNLYILGNTTTINTTSFTVQDALITLGVGNYATDLLDIGFTGHYNNGTNAHTGFIRDASVKEFFIFDGYTPELDANNNININDASFNKANLNAGVFKGNLIGSTAVVNGLDLYNYTTSAFAKGNTVGNLAQAGFDVANTASANTIYAQGVNDTQNTNISSVNTFASGAYDKANSANVMAQAAFDKANTSVSTPSGSDTQVQFNDGGSSFGADSTFAFDKTSKILSVQQISVTNSTGDEGGEILLAKPVSNTTLSGTGVTVDVYQNKIRFFEQGGSARGYYLDISSGGGGAGTNIMSGGGGASTDQYARDTANTAASNITILQGVDATQNSNIAFLTVYTQAAFDKANTGGGGSGADQFARDTANSKTYTFYQNTAPSTSNAHDLWVNSSTGFVYENFGNTTNPIWAEFGPTPSSNVSNNIIINTLDRLSNLTSSLILNNDGSLSFTDNTIQTTAYTGFGIDNVARTTANTANVLAQEGFNKANSANVMAQAAFNKANTAVASTIGKAIAMAIVFGG